MEKQFDGREKRKFKCAVFSMKDGITGIFSSPDFADDSITAIIMYLSAGGLQFILPRNTTHDISTRDCLILSKIQGMTDLKFPYKVELKIKWIMDLKHFEHIGVGCEILNAPDVIRDQIDQFVDFEKRYVNYPQ